MDSFRHEMELKRHCLRPHKEKVDLRVFSKAVLGLERRHQVIDTCVLRVLDTWRDVMNRIDDVDADVDRLGEKQSLLYI